MKHVIEEIKSSWFLIAFLAGMIIWYADTNNRLTTVEAEVKEVQSTLSLVSDIKTDIAVMKTDIGYIKTKIK